MRTTTTFHHSLVPCLVSGALSLSGSAKVPFCVILCNTFSKSMVVLNFHCTLYLTFIFVKCSFQHMPKFEGALEINNNLTKTKRLFEGQLVGPESFAVDSTGN